MKKLSLLLLLSVFVFCGCSDDDDTKTYVLSLPNYETHTLDMGDQENPDDSWSVSSDWGTTNYKYNLLLTLVVSLNLTVYLQHTVSIQIVLHLQIVQKKIAQTSQLMIIALSLKKE